MNNNEIAFIMCTNDEQYCEECIRYINDLKIPEGYEIDVITVKDAPSMTAGYNAAMNSSEAKYKVYLHHDVFIMNENFIYDMLDTFKDESIGMLGVIGKVEVVPDADYFLAWDVGKIHGYNCYNFAKAHMAQNDDKTPIEVSAIDGLLMVTQYDITWREDVFDGFDYYDISQSVEMRKAGYKVVVPYQESVWCYHDMRVNQLGRYDEYRIKLLETYPEVYDGSNVTYKYSVKEKMELAGALQKNMLDLLNAGAYNELTLLCDKLREMIIEKTIVREVVNLMEIYKAEERNGAKHCEWYAYTDWDKINKEYRELQFVLIRYGYNKLDERISLIIQKLQQGVISLEAAMKVASVVIPDGEETLRRLLHTMHN